MSDQDEKERAVVMIVDRLFPTAQLRQSTKQEIKATAVIATEIEHELSSSPPMPGPYARISKPMPGPAG